MQVFIAAGSNIGNRSANLEAAQCRLMAMPRIHFKKSSQIRETDPVGGPAQGRYLNAVWEIETGLSAHELLALCHDIEKDMGRVRHGINEPRIIDLDILFYGDLISEGAWLQIPHPRFHERLFVIEPLAEIAPEFVHPKLGVSIKSLLESFSERV